MISTAPAPDREQHAIALAHTTAQRWFNRGTVVDNDDILGAAMLGAAKALDRYDGREGVAFASYAIRLIRGEIQEELRRWDYLDRKTRERLRGAELPAWLMAPSSLDEMLTEVGPSLVDALADRATDVEAEVLERLEPSGTEQGALYAALESLDAKQREAVEWIYWQNGSKIDLALRWGFSNRNPVNRRLESAFRKLRRRLETIP